jgi:hypothetical protein
LEKYTDNDDDDEVNLILIFGIRVKKDVQQNQNFLIHV